MLRTSLPLAALALLALLLPSAAPAGGLIRRIPEVGEYAKFSYQVTPDPLKPGKLAWEGEMILRCVGAADIDGRRHLWIEIEESRQTFDAMHIELLSTSSHITKLLVAEETLLSNDCEIARGWVRFSEDEPREVAGGLASELVSGALYGMVREDVRRTFIGYDDEEAIEAPIEITIAGEMRELTTAVAGTRTSTRTEPREEYVATLKRDWASIWWLEDDLAFGVAAWGCTITGTEGVLGRMRPDRPWAMTQRYQLVEFGTGAVSGLPDHN
jgi:hypothetical protein